MNSGRRWYQPILRPTHLSRFETSMNRMLAVAIAALGWTIASGCAPGGPTLGKVTGQVTLDGKPLPNVAVTFMPAGEGGSASGITDANGNYELTHANGKGTPVGKNKVAVTTKQKPQESIDMSKIPSDSPEYAKALEQSQSGYNVIFKEPIPEKYNVKTELEFEVKSGSQVINLELKSS
jgi:hypothetical protein